MAAFWRQTAGKSCVSNARRDESGLELVIVFLTQDTRFALHNAGRVRSTRPRRPFELIFYEAYRNERYAKRRERYLKTGKGRNTLNAMLRNFIAEVTIAQG